MGKRATELHKEFSARKNEKRWKWIDTTKQTPQQTVKETVEAIKKII